MAVRRILDVITDILTLVALAIAGAGHFLHWANVGMDRLHATQPLPLELQEWQASRSGIALGVAAFLVFISLVFDLGTRTRRFLVIFTFVAVLVAIAFQLVIYSPYPVTQAQQALGNLSVYAANGFLVALIPSIVAAGLCLLRMTWTMTASPNPGERRAD
jgi:hypothetical protein